MLFLHLIKLVVDVSKIVSGIWLILQFVAFSAFRFFLLISFVYLLFLFLCILATEDKDHMVLQLSAVSLFVLPISYFASQKCPS